MKPAHDLSRLMKFLNRDPWQACMDEVLAAHFEPAMEAFDLDDGEIDDILDGHWAATLWGCAFEDLLTREFNGANIVDDYLKRRGWSESAPAKAYMRGLQNSVMSLYEASEIIPGQSFLARDLIRGGEPVLVSEKSATQTLKPWERIAARIVPVGHKHVLSGGLLPFSVEAADHLLDGLRKAARKRSRRAKLTIDDDSLQALAPLFTSAWLFDVLPRALGLVQPIIHNSDGDELVFHQVRYPLASGVTQAMVAERLDGIDSLRRETRQFWNWIESPPAQPKAQGAEALTWSTAMDDGALVFGNVELKGRALLLLVNSAARAERGRAMLEATLGDLVRSPLTEIQTVDQLLESRAGQEPPAAEVPPEIATAAVHALLDKQYRATLDAPVGMLGDISPRQAARTAVGRAKLVAC